MDEKKQLFVVGIGASAGGLDAVQQLFDNLPDETGMAFVIVQHLSPDFKSLMPELLAKHTKMKIYTAKDQLEIQPNCIYLNERSKNLQIENNRLVLPEKASKGNLNLPIDIFFHSLGEEFMDFSYGIILSGTGTDGSRGIKTIKEAGGTIMVQEPATAQFDGMPNSAIATNLPDFILPPKQIAEKIIQLNNKRIDLVSDSQKSDDYEKVYDSILELIYKSTGVNFKKYKTNTLLRRLEKRMSIHNVETLKGYFDLLKNNEKEKITIYQEFLIGVTNFFRDEAAFKVIANKLLPSLFNVNKKTKTLRIWVAGCSTGEEVYSLAILFQNYIALHKLKFDFKIFATDIDRKAIQIASTGIYPVNNIADIEKSLLEKYFMKAGDRIQIVKAIREKIVFSYHDVTKDPPFIRMDMISCRNLLIYFNNNTQNKVLHNFQYALNKSGFLFLGSSESLGQISKHFDVIDSKWKIYQCNTENSRIGSTEDFENEPSKGLQYLQESYQSKLKENSGHNMQDLAFYKYLSNKYSPTSVFIDVNFDILFTVGNIKPLITLSDGQFYNNLLKITGVDLSTIIRNGIRRVIKENQPVVYKNISIKTDGQLLKSDISFENIKSLSNSEQTYLVEFINIKQDTESNKIVISENDLPNLSKQRIEDLEWELNENRAELQNVVEELETSNEELQSSNEELMSSNEELQSSNEELQSVNEELYTVNTELQEKNKELENLNNDITNLLNAGDVGTLFLDIELNIRKFTPVVKKIFKLEESDIGRSIISFASEFDENKRKTIINCSRTSLEELKSFEQEIQDNNHNWHLVKINPFLTSKKTIEGVVINFINLGPIKKVKTELYHSEEKLSTALEVGNMAWWELELPSGTVSFSENKARMIGRNPSDFKHYKDFTDLVHPEDYENTMDAMRNYLDGKVVRYECQYRIKNQAGDYQWFQDIGKITYKKDENIKLVGIVHEITEAKKAELELIEAKQKAETANIYKNQFLANMSHEIRTPMNGLVGFADLLRIPDLSQETREQYISIIENSSKQLLNLINDIIDLSKIEAQELNIGKTRCDIDKLFWQLETTFNELKKKKNKEHLSISAEIPVQTEKLSIYTDPERLQQVMSNLIVNALKFTEKGGITFGYKLNKETIYFYVKDTGVGIPQEKIELIFERFQQVDNGKLQFHEGTGLGLAISKGIVKLLGGFLKVETEEGKGSTFSFTLPLIEAKSKKSITKESSLSNYSLETLENKTILIAEDEPVNQEYFKASLQNMPFKIIFAENGKIAVEIIKSNPEIDLILMDLKMPLMDGYDATEAILKIKPNAKIIAQTAYAMASDKAKCLDKGFVDYISKPIDKRVLIEKIVMWTK